jgi:hypothetical protein
MRIWLQTKGEGERGREREKTLDEMEVNDSGPFISSLKTIINHLK